MVGDFFMSSFLGLRVGRQHENKDIFTYYKYPELHSHPVSVERLPPCEVDHVRIVVVADTHTRHDCVDHLPPSDLLVHCGDIMMTGRLLSPSAQLQMLSSFDRWMGEARARHRLFVAGNHDYALYHHLDKAARKATFANAQYLENDLVEVEDLQVFATPISHGKSSNQAFQTPAFFEHSLRKVQQLASARPMIDVLITHGLSPDIEEAISHRLHLCGHFHERYGVAVLTIEEEFADGTWVERSARRPFSADKVQRLEQRHGPRTTQHRAKRVRVCAPICDKRYNLTNAPIVVDFPRRFFASQSEPTAVTTASLPEEHRITREVL